MKTNTKQKRNKAMYYSDDDDDDDDDDNNNNNNNNNNGINVLLIGSRNNVVGIMVDCGLDDRGAKVRVPVG
jgi:hypothetical protein